MLNRFTRRTRSVSSLIVVALALSVSAANAQQIDSADAWWKSVDGPPSADAGYFTESGQDGRKAVFSSLTNLEIADVHGASSVWAQSTNTFGLTGDGVKVAVQESGTIFSSHVEFGGPLSGRVINHTSLRASSHATSMGGIIAGQGVDTRATGMATGATLIHHTWGFDQDSLIANNVWVANHSYGEKVGWTGAKKDGIMIWGGDTSIDAEEEFRFGLYGMFASLYDGRLMDAPYHMVVKSAGNSTGLGVAPGEDHYIVNTLGQLELSTETRQVNGGDDGYDTILPDHSASKNTLTVGAAKYDASGEIVVAAYSSVGPVDDGRIKPEIVAMGEGSIVPKASSATAYGTTKGTSPAAAVVSGNLALIYEFVNKNYAAPLRASTMKALLTHTATDIEAAGPDYKSGFGLLNVAKAVNVLQDNATYGPEQHIQERPMVTGQTATHFVDSFGVDTIKVTIAWHDPSAPEQYRVINDRRAALINDFDLRVTGPDGVTLQPFILDHLNPSALATTGDNVVDNIEQIVIANPIPGPYTISITSKGSVIGSPVVSMVVTGNAAPISLPIVLSAFDVHVDNQRVELAWTTTEESEVAWIEVEQQIDSKGSFRPVSRVAPKGGSDIIADYAIEVENVKAGTHNWRLAVTNLDGTVDYSEVLEATIAPNASLTLSAPWPNPSAGRTQLNIVAAADQTVKVEIIDSLGRRVAAEYELDVVAGFGTDLELDTTGFAPGLYVVRASANGFLATQSLVVGI